MNSSPKTEMKQLFFLELIVPLGSSTSELCLNSKPSAKLLIAVSIINRIDFLYIAFYMLNIDKLSPIKFYISQK